MATNGNLGEYKVVISADYKDLQTQIKAATDVIQQSITNIEKQFDVLASKINASVFSINTNISEMSQTFARVGAENLSKEIESLGNSTEKAAPKAKKTADGYKTLESQVRKARLEAQKEWIIGGDDKLFTKHRDNFTDLTTQLKKFNTDLKEYLTQWDNQEKEHYERIEQRAKQNAQNNKQYWIDMENERKRRTAQIKDDFEAVAPAIQPLRTQLSEAKKAAENAFGTDKFETAKNNYQELAEKSNAIKRELNGINSNGMNGLEKSLIKSTASMTALERITNKMRSHVEWMISATLSGTLILAPIAALHSIADVEQQMAGMIQTLPQLHNNQEKVNQTATQFIGIAEQYGVGIDKIIESGKLWSRGYKDVDDVMKLTALSAKLAVADLMDVGLANKAVESVINSFGRQGDAVNFATHVTDSWTNVAHNAQSSATDLASAMMRSGAAAHAVGVSFDMATAMASTMIKTTGLQGENVGNALKSIFSSLQSDKAIADLQKLGIAVYQFNADGTREFRDLEKVMVDLMLASHDTQESMAKTLQNISGGKFQWSKVAAMFSDYKDFIHAYTLSVTSTNFAEGQVGAQIDTINRRLEQLKQSLIGVLNNVGNAGLTTFIKDVLQGAKQLIDYLQRIPPSVYATLESIAKWYVYGRLAILSLNGLNNAIKVLQGGIARTTLEKTADTLATMSNTMAQNANSGATERAAAGSAADALAKGVETTATVAATGATVGFATAMAYATAGISVIAGTLALATTGYGLLAASADTATEKLQRLDDETQKSIDIKKEELQNNYQSEKLLDTLGGAYIKLQSALANTSQDSENFIRLQEDMKATDEDLAKVVSEDSMKRIRNGEDVQQVINDEKKAHTDKKKSIEAEIKKLREEQKTYTSDSIQKCQDRIDALKSEGTAWNTFQSIVSKAIGYLKKLEGEFISMVGRIDKFTSPTDFGKASAQRIIDKGEKMIAEGENDIAWNPNDDEIAKIENEKTNLKLKLAKIEQDEISDLNENYAGTTIGGTQAPQTDKEKKAAEKSAAGVDNSNEAQAWRFLKGKGLTNELSSGLIGNWEIESPGLNADTWDSAGESYGIGQWTVSTGRYKKLIDYAKAINGDASTLETQLNFAWYELTEGDYANALPKIAQEATNPENAAYAVAKYYEQPAWAANPERQSQARSIFDKMGSRNGEQNVTDYEKQQKSVEEIQKRQYDTLKKQYDVLVAQVELELRRKNQYMTANDRLYLWNKVMGVNGGNVDFNKTVTASSGSQFNELTAEGGTWRRETSNVDIEGLSDRAKSTISAAADYFFKQTGRQLIVSSGKRSWGGHTTGEKIDLVDDAGHNTLENNENGIRDGLIAYLHSLGVGAVDEYSHPSSSATAGHVDVDSAGSDWYEGTNYGGFSNKGTTSSKIVSTLSEFQKANAQMIGSSLKEKSELWKDKYAYNEAVTSAGGISTLAKLESTIQQSVNANKPLGKTEEKIYEEMLKIKGGQALKGSPEWYKVQTAIAKLYADEKRKQLDFEEKASQKHVSALTAMTEKEMDWANKHNLISDRQMLDYQINKNETNYAKNSGLMESELSKTAQTGQEKAIVDSFHKMMQAVTEEEAKAEAEHLMTLSADTDATIKAVNKMQDSYEKYYQTREELAEKYEDSIRRYWFAGVSGLQSGLESAMDGILNKTKSFAQAFRDIFSSVWKALVSQFSKDFASRITQVLSPIRLNKNQGNTVPIFGNYNAVAGMGGGLMSGLLGGKGGTASLYKPITQFSSQIFNTMNITKNAVASSMQAISSTSLNTIDGIKNSFLQAELEKRTASKITGNTITQGSETTKTSVLANISTMVTQMLAAMAIMWALSAIFGGGGDSKETSTSEVNLGRNPASYYTTPRTISQIQVPSFDTGALQIPQDMLAMVHRNEMVIPADLADNIRNMSSTSNTSTGGKVVVHNNVNASAIDGRGIKEMLHTNNRTLAKSVKEAYRRFDTNV